MARFHINGKGEPGVCRAQHSCPFGSAADHYDSKEQAQQAFETSMQAQAVAKPAQKRPLKELNEIAKTSTDQDELAQAMMWGSERTMKNLTKNKAAEEKVLRLAYENSTDQATRNALVRHEAFPVSAMTTEEFVDQFKTADVMRQARLLESDELDDAKFIAAQGGEASSFDYKFQAAIGNANNRLTDASVIPFAETSWGGIGKATRAGRYPVERIKDLPKDLIYWGNVMNAPDAETLDAYADWVVANKDSYHGEADYLSHQIARHSKVSSKTLRKLALNDMGATSVYSNPKSDSGTKALAASANVEIGRMAKIEELEDRFGGNLKDEIITEEVGSQPFANRGIHDTRIIFDADRVKELGMTAEDIYTFMGRGKYNGGVSYDPESGVFRGTIDSTD